MKKALGFSLALLAAGPVRAEDVAPAIAMTSGHYAEVPAQYERVLQEAIVEFNAGRFTEARALFAQAHALFANARTYRALGLVEYELRNYARSIEALSRALDDQRRPLEPAARPPLVTTIEQASRFVGRFYVASNASVLVDGHAAIRDSDGAVLVEAGKHVLAIDGKEHALDVRGGERVDLRPAVVPAVSQVPGATGAAQAKPVMASEPLTQAPVESTPSGAPTLPQLALIGGGGVLFASGLVVGVVALDAHADFEASCPEGQAVCSSSARDKERSVETLSVVSDVLWISGLAAASAGLVWWLLDDSASSESAHASVWSNGQASGVDVRGRF